MSISIKQHITRNLINIPGWRTKRKIVVIESDDWGSIRMASKEAYHHFLKMGYPVDRCPYNRFDALESNNDLELLFEVLASVKDKNGNPAIITANNVVANPDFDRIKESGFQQYFYEPFTETLARYPNHDRVYDLYKEGIAHKVFKPQFHGREHLNVERWMLALQDGNKSALDAFEQKMFSVHVESNPVNRMEYMDALDCDSPEQLKDLHQILREGLDLFEKLWGYKSKSFIASCYIWSPELEPILKQSGVQYIQGSVVQTKPILENGYQYKHIYHYQGQRNITGQRYLVRNAYFELSQTENGFDIVNDCLNRVATAFRWNKPAIISSHRLGFMGSLDSANRDKNLVLLRKLLKSIVQQWPDVEFMTSDELGDLIIESEK